MVGHFNHWRVALHTSETSRRPATDNIKECSYQINTISLSLAAWLRAHLCNDMFEKSQHLQQPNIPVHWSESCLEGIDTTDKSSSSLLDII